MQIIACKKIDKITQPFPKILTLSYFGEGSTCPGMPDQNQLLLQNLTKGSTDNYMEKMNIITQIVFEKLKFKNSSDLIGREHFGL